jgi:hypothetical protein
VVTCLPESPRFESSAEHDVFEVLREQLRPEDVLIANQRFLDRTKDHEVDLFVLMPGYGVVAVEVKGGSVRHNGEGWEQRSRSGNVRRVDPVDQARTALYAARDYVERDPRWRDSSRSRIRWGYAVAFPYTDLDDDFAAPDAPRWLVQDKADLAHLRDRLREVVAGQETRNRVPDLDDVELVREILRGRNRPEFSVTAEADERDAEAQRLTQEQLMLLRVTRLLNRVEVRGGAGSGKTVLALQQVRELARGGGPDKRSPQRVGLVCYSRGLATFFRRVTGAWPRKERPAFVGTFEELGQLWGAEPERDWLERVQPPPGPTRSTRYYEEALPEQMAHLARALEPGHRYDSFVVDEAQDFADLWWQPILGALKDEEAGGLYLYSDANQRVFSRFGAPPVPLVPLVLDHNLRNTAEIGRTINPLAPNRMRLLGGHGPEVTWVQSTKEGALEAAEEQVLELLEEGWRAQDVALLTVGSRHSKQKDAYADPEAYWSTFWDDADVFYGHVLGCKGLERRAVVLCVNKDEVHDRDREKLYVGLSRATDRLVVVGDAGYVRAVCGDEVARHLGIPT